jgi:hypothetical protein
VRSCSLTPMAGGGELGIEHSFGILYVYLIGSFPRRVLKLAFGL